MIGRTRGMISEWEPKIEQVVSNFLDVLQCCWCLLNSLYPNAENGRYRKYIDPRLQTTHSPFDVLLAIVT